MSKAYDSSKARLREKPKQPTTESVEVFSPEPEPKVETRAYKSGRLISSSEVELPDAPSNPYDDQALVSPSGTNKTIWRSVGDLVEDTNSHPDLTNRGAADQHPQQAITDLVDDQATQDADIAANKTKITTNTADIATNAAGIATNAADIATNTAGIATNAADIATNAADIATNAADIATNTAGKVDKAGDTMTGSLWIDGGLGTVYKNEAGEGQGYMHAATDVSNTFSELNIVGTTDNVTPNVGIRFVGSYTYIHSPTVTMAIPGAQIGSRLVVTAVDSTTGHAQLGWEDPPTPAYEEQATNTNDVLIGAGNGIQPWVQLATITLAQGVNGISEFYLQLYADNTSNRTGRVQFGFGVNGAEPINPNPLSKDVPANYNGLLSAVEGAAVNFPTGTTISMWARADGDQAQFSVTSRGTIDPAGFIFKFPGSG